MLYRLLTVIPVGVAALALLVVAIPRLQASLAWLPVDRAIDDHWREAPLDASMIPPLVSDARSSIGYHPDAIYSGGLGFLHWLLGTDVSTPEPKRRYHLFTASAHLRESLARAPLQPYTWLRLARIELLHDPAADTRFNDAYRMSILSARADAHIVLDRMELGLRHFDKLDRETRKLLVDQLGVARKLHGDTFDKRVAELTAPIRHALAVAREENPELLSIMESALATTG